MEENFIFFKTEDGVKVKVYFNFLKYKKVLSVEKPANISMCPSKAYKASNHLNEALNEPLSFGKDSVCSPVYFLEPEVAGVTLWSLDEVHKQRLNNAYGSNKFEFSFLFWCINTGSSRDEVFCDLPLFWDDNEKKMRVSHKNGKKCFTEFNRVKKFGVYELWSAKCNFFRLHQIRLHALECGLKIFGESIYSSPSWIMVSSLKRKSYRSKDGRAESHIYPSLHLILEKTICSEEGIKVYSSPSKKWSSIESTLARYLVND